MIGSNVTKSRIGHSFGRFFNLESITRLSTLHEDSQEDSQETSHEQCLLDISEYDIIEDPSESMIISAFVRIVAFSRSFRTRHSQIIS